MFRLTKLNFKNAMMSSETLFGLGLEIAAAIMYSYSMSISSEGLLLGSVFCVLPIVAGAFITFALTVDNDSGSVRNRIIMGYSRIKLLLAQVFSAMLLSLVYILVSIIPVLILCHDIIGKGRTAGETWYALVVAVSSYFVLAALGAVLAAVLFSRTAAILAYILLFIVFSFVASSFSIFENKYDRNTVMGSDEGAVTEFTENKSYIPEPLRTMLKPIFFISPIEQGMVYDLSKEAYVKKYEKQLQEEMDTLRANIEKYPDTYTPPKYYEEYLNDEVRRYEEFIRDNYLLPVYSGVMILIITGVGLLIYRKVNIY